MTNNDIVSEKSKILKSIHAPLLGSGDRSDDDDSGSEFDEMEARPPVPIPINGLTIPQYLMSDNYARPYRYATTESRVLARLCKQS